MDQIKDIPKVVAVDSMNYAVAGFSFAAAIAWMDVVRWMVSKVVSSKTNSGSHFLGTAIITTLIAVLVFKLLTTTGLAPVKPAQPVFAVTRG